jgi:hypothetical protein
MGVVSSRWAPLDDAMVCVECVHARAACDGDACPAAGEADEDDETGEEGGGFLVLDDDADEDDE